MQEISVCHESGCKAGDYCDKENMWVQKSGLKSAPCPYHRLLHMDPTGKYRVNSDCEDIARMKHVPWFILPPSEEIYYKRKNATYASLPPMKPGCGNNITMHSMELIYPKEGSKIYVPLELDGKLGRTIFEAAHRKSGTIIYWHLDDNYLGSTSGIHQMALAPEEGKHRLTIVDESGETVEVNFEIIGKKK